jgi:hypothetical protein
MQQKQVLERAFAMPLASLPIRPDRTGSSTANT